MITLRPEYPLEDACGLRPSELYSTMLARYLSLLGPVRFAAAVRSSLVRPSFLPPSVRPDSGHGKAERARERERASGAIREIVDRRRRYGHRGVIYGGRSEDYFYGGWRSREGRKKEEGRQK